MQTPRCSARRPSAGSRRDPSARLFCRVRPRECLPRCEQMGSVPERIREVRKLAKHRCEGAGGGRSVSMDVRVEGDPNEVNSFVACMAAVTAAWGRPVSYDELAGLCGVAFSPPWNADQATHWA